MAFYRSVFLASKVAFCSYFLIYRNADASEPVGISFRDEVIKKMSGCFVVDYMFTETEAVQDGYTLDRRVYEVNQNKTTFEYVFPIQKSPTEFRLQHVLFVKNLSGEVVFTMKHHGEDWSYEPDFLFDFVKPNVWLPVRSSKGKWVRKVTNLDDGLRYQCAAPWNDSESPSKWSCSNFAPIPGRESRDMGRSDYNTLERNTDLVLYPNSFLERQNNLKVELENGEKNVLAKELGKTWYVRQPMKECGAAKDWASKRLAFWKLVMNEWEKVYATPQPVLELITPDGRPRFAALNELEEKVHERLNNDSSLQKEVSKEISHFIHRSLSRNLEEKK
jgi:hypothetical protein